MENKQKRLRVMGIFFCVVIAFTLGLIPIHSVPTVYTVSLSWTPAVGFSTGDTYNVYRSTTSGTYSNPPLASGIAVASYVDKSVLPGTTYFYVTSHVSGGAESVFSNEAQAVIPGLPLPPSGCGATVTKQ